MARAYTWSPYKEHTIMQRRGHQGESEETPLIAGLHEIKKRPRLRYELIGIFFYISLTSGMENPAKL